MPLNSGRHYSPPNAISIRELLLLNYGRRSPIPIGGFLGGLICLILGGIVSQSHIEGPLEDMSP